MPAQDIPIPKQMSHLPLDDRGYPIPRFAAERGGEADFRLIDARKMARAVQEGRCAVCGKKLDFYKYIITGPLGYRNRAVTDPAMHEACARYSLKACPHLAMKNAQRREAGLKEAGAYTDDPLHVKEKPDHVALVCIKSQRLEWISAAKRPVIIFDPVDVEWYTYDDHQLVPFDTVRNS